MFAKTTKSTILSELSVSSMPTLATFWSDQGRLYLVDDSNFELSQGLEVAKVGGHANPGLEASITRKCGLRMKKMTAVMYLKRDFTC